MQLPDFEVLQLLHFPGRPANDDLLDMRVFAETEVEAAIILRAEAVPPRYLLRLLPPIPIDRYLRADGAAIALGALQSELDPAVLRSDRILIEQQRTSLIGDDHVQHPSVPEIRHGDRTAVIEVCHP